MRVFLLALGVLSSGCDDPIKPPQRIDEMRVLAARLEVAGAPDRASPGVGERARLRWLVAHPAGGGSHGWSFLACPAAGTTKGVPQCDGAAFAEARSDAPSADEPAIEFEVPAGITQILVQGAVCAGENPELRLPLEATRCLGQRSLVATSIPVAGANLNPRIDSDALELDAAPWAPPTALVESCDGTAPNPALPRVRANGARHQVTLTLGETDRAPTGGSSSPEPLLVAHYATRGLFERVYTAIEPDQAPRAEVGWEAPKSIAEPSVARIYLVVRDSEGAADYAVRTLCVVP